MASATGASSSRLQTAGSSWSTTTDAPPQAVAYENVESAELGRRGTLEVSTTTGDLTVEYVVGDLAGLVQHVNQRIWDVLHSGR